MTQTILRKGYYRKPYTRKDGTKVKGTYVEPTRVPDKGKPGKTPKSKRVLPSPTKASLSTYGYVNVKNKSDEERRRAIKRGVKKEGYSTIIRRIVLISNYNKYNSPESYKIMRSDIKWMQDNLAEKSSSPKKNSPKRKSPKKNSPKRKSSGKKTTKKRSPKRKSPKISSKSPVKELRKECRKEKIPKCKGSEYITKKELLTLLGI